MAAMMAEAVPILGTDNTMTKMYMAPNIPINHFHFETDKTADKFPLPKKMVKHNKAKVPTA